MTNPVGITICIIAIIIMVAMAVCVILDIECDCKNCKWKDDLNEKIFYV